jgi:sulfite exporter TauE/SafE
MMITEGFLLGISTGAMCLAYCGPVLIPLMLAEGKNVRKSAYYLLYFLTGRLLAYIIAGFIVGFIGKTVILPSKYTVFGLGIIYILLAILLIVYGFHRFKEICFGQVQRKINSAFKKRFPKVVVIISGAITGLNICPPFLIAITKAAETGNIASSILFFLMFFVGTTIYFIPIPFVGLFKRQQVFGVIGKFAAILTGFIFLYQGTLMILN